MTITANSTQSVIKIISILRYAINSSEPPSVEDDVDVWHYAIVSCMPETKTTTINSTLQSQLSVIIIIIITVIIILIIISLYETSLETFVKINLKET